MKISKFMGGEFGSKHITEWYKVWVCHNRVLFHLHRQNDERPPLQIHPVIFFTKKLENKEIVIKKKNGHACDAGLYINMHQAPQT